MESFNISIRNPFLCTRATFSPTRFLRCQLMLRPALAYPITVLISDSPLDVAENTSISRVCAVTAMLSPVRAPFNSVPTDITPVSVGDRLITISGLCAVIHYRRNLYKSMLFHHCRYVIADRCGPVAPYPYVLHGVVQKITDANRISYFFIIRFQEAGVSSLQILPR